LTVATHLERAIHDFFEASPWRGQVGVVAVSGGADSVALAHAICRSPFFPQLVLAHLNHRLRGDESDGDEEFVRSLPLPWNLADHVDVRTSRCDIAALASDAGGNLEATARQQRYAFLQQVAVDADATWVATGHTADDQAETVLFRLLRGTGLKGLSGVPTTRELVPGIMLVRPMLSLRRGDVRDHLHTYSLSHRDDASNADLRFTRNRIRHELIPHLEATYNSALVEVLGRLAKQADAIQDEMERLAAEVLARGERPRAGPMVVIAVESLREVAECVAAEMFRLVWRREGWPMGEMNHDDWQNVAALAMATSGSQHFPGGVRARRVGRVLQLERQCMK
jgi:tRNA(Ile)-lysidine synthase